MKKLMLAFCLFCSVQGSSQYWQQEVNYLIDVTLNEKEKTLDGFEKITYTNHSPDTLKYIPFHLWPNAYKNDRTAFSDQMLENGKTSFYFSDVKQKGYINQLDFKVNGVRARLEDHPEHIDIVYLRLPQPLAPGATIQITTPFHVKLPYNFSRSGYDGRSIQATQWYPKPAVYDSKGWHPLTYLDQGEFYSEFGSYDVHITVPSNYVVAATGKLEDESEKAWLKNRTSVKTFTASTGNKTLHYRQDKVHDFAWFANPSFLVQSDTCLVGNRTIDVWSFYTAQEEKNWKNALQWSKDAIRFYSGEIGYYPYDVLSVVQGPQSFGGGMEYPTITVIAPIKEAGSLDLTIAHEIGHNWFYGILASNERAHPCMDEGLNSFYENKYRKGKYGLDGFEEVLFQTRAFFRRDQPITTSSEAMSEMNYNLVSYHKTAAWLELVEKQLGEVRFREFMQNYYRKWQFRHPQPEHFRTSLSAALGSDTTLLPLLDQKGILPGKRSKEWVLASPLAPSSLDNYVSVPVKNVLLVSPSVGINSYDGFMLGALVSNYQLPPSKLQFLFSPLYSFSAQTINEIGSLHYTKVNEDNSRWRLGIGGMRFSKNKQLDTLDNKLFENFYRITPQLRFTFSQGARSTLSRWIEAKAFIIGEKDFSKFTVRSTDGLVYVDSLESSNRYLNQLTYAAENTRALYPYQYQVQLQQGKEFMRINLTGNYFFNYVKGGGFNVRFFAAKFFNLTDQPFGGYRYQPKLLGVTGEEDYTYSNYFVGRTATDALEGTALDNGGLPARQIMIRDGGLKMRLDQFEGVQGRSDNWVAAFNFTTTLPNKLFPVKLPILLFFDVGTYAEPWRKGSEESRFLYVGGLQLSLFKGLFNVYAPLVYSGDIRENLKSLPEKNSFLKRLTFSIDIQKARMSQLTGFNLY